MAAVATQYNKQTLGGVIKIGAALQNYSAGDGITIEDETGFSILQIGSGSFNINPFASLVLSNSSIFIAGGTVSFSALPVQPAGATGTVWNDNSVLRIIGPTNSGPTQYIALMTVTGTTAPSVSAAVKHNTLGFTPYFNPIGTGNWQILGPTGASGFPQNSRTVEWGMLKSADGANGFINESDVYASDDGIEFYTYDTTPNLATTMSNIMLKITIYP